MFKKFILQFKIKNLIKELKDYEDVKENIKKYLIHINEETIIKKNELMQLRVDYGDLINGK